MDYPDPDAEIRVGSVETSFELVAALKELDGAGLSEIADHLDKPKTTVYDHLETLSELEFVVATADGTYELGPRFLDFGGYARNRMKIYQVGKPEIRDLAMSSGEQTNILIEEHGRGVYLYTFKGEDAVRLDTYAGLHVPLQTTALGKAILSRLPRSRVEAIVDRHGMPAITENTITERDELFEELETIRERGYATDEGERVEGMRCIAAPITDSNDSPIGAISVSGPKNRIRDERFYEEIPNKVLRAANVIEVNITFS